jgi:heat shock factor-binding protein 1
MPLMYAIMDLFTGTSTDPQQQGPESGSDDLATVVDDLLNQLSNKFTTISSELLTKSESDMPT